LPPELNIATLTNRNSRIFFVPENRLHLRSSQFTNYPQRLFKCLLSIICRTEKFSDAALLIERREVELETGKAAPVGSRRKRSCGRSYGMLEETF
jgi:hypothetical protein